MTKAEEWLYDKWLYDNRLAIMYEVKKGRFKEVIEAAFNHEPVVITKEVIPMTTNEAELSAIKFLKYARNLLKSL